MRELHFKDPDLRNSTLDIGFPCCGIEKDNFIDSQGKQICMENKKESCQAKAETMGTFVLLLQSLSLLLKVPYLDLMQSSPNLVRLDNNATNIFS